jgi:hypothetical protein
MMDLTPFATDMEGHSHIVLIVPCNENGLKYPQLPE